MANLTTAGATPTPLDVLRAQLLAIATGLAPGLTADLPGSLVEDMASTATGAVAVQDLAFVDLVNSISPNTANDFILTQLGNVYGVQQGVGSNTSVLVEFTGTPGFVVNAGFLVGDGQYTYVVQDPTVIPSGGTTAGVYCLAQVAGTFPVPANTVTSLITSVPAGVSLSCTNPTNGTPGAAAQDINEFRAQVVQAGKAVATGMPTFVKTALQNVPGVQARLISLISAGGGWEIIVGGGDPYSVAGAIFQSMFAFNTLVGKQTIGTTETITIDDYPDSYSIVFVIPTQQTVGITCNWETAASSNFVSNAVVSAAVVPALVNYVNSITVGRSISVLELEATFIAATAGIINPTLISKLTFAVTINGSSVAPPTGGVLIAADPEGYYFSQQSNIVVTNT